MKISVDLMFSTTALLLTLLVVSIVGAVEEADSECRWGDWSPCDAPCGGGIQRRSMDCCDCTPRVEIRSCNRDPCPVDGAWGPWSAFGACSRSCGGGEQIRSRSCNNPPVAGDGQPCQGPSAEIQACNDQGCSVDGGWSEWSDWSACNVNSCTCARMRTCTSPAPMNRGRPCMGTQINQRACLLFCCLPNLARFLGLGNRPLGPFGGMGGGNNFGGRSWMRC